MKKSDLLIDFLAMVVWNSQKLKVKEGEVHHRDRIEYLKLSMMEYEKLIETSDKVDVQR